MRIEITEEEKELLIKCLYQSMGHIHELNKSVFTESAKMQDILNAVHNLYNKVVSIDE